jgi:hypothetical protein
MFRMVAAWRLLLSQLLLLLLLLCQALLDAC